MANAVLLRQGEAHADAWAGSGFRPNDELGFQNCLLDKVSRRKVHAIVALSNAVIRSNLETTTLCSAVARGLPLHNERGSATLTGKESKTQ